MSPPKEPVTLVCTVMALMPVDTRLDRSLRASEAVARSVQSTTWLALRPMLTRTPRIRRASVCRMNRSSTYACGILRTPSMFSERAVPRGMSCTAISTWMGGPPEASVSKRFLYSSRNMSPSVAAPMAMTSALVFIPAPVG
jgi:hypothetical protein